MKSLLAGFAASLLILSACGGGGGSSSSSGSGSSNGGSSGSSSQIADATIQGVVATNKAIVGGKVDVKCDGTSKFITTATTDDNGKWSASVPTAAFPCRLRVEGGNLLPRQSLDSIAVKAGNANITPLVELVLSPIFRTKPSHVAESGLTDSTVKLNEIIDKATLDFQKIMSQVSDWGALKNLSPLYDNFLPRDGDPHFEMLKSYSSRNLNHSQMIVVAENFSSTSSSTPSQILDSINSILNRQKDTGVAWDAAIVYLPGAKEATNISALKTIVKATPVAIGFHGCGGLGSLPTLWGQNLADLGYAVVMPDSFARPIRNGLKTCSGTTTGLNSEDLYFMRTEEIYYALDKVLNQPWVNRRQVLLFGQSEGALAVNGGSVIGQEGLFFYGATAAITSGYWCGAGSRSIYTQIPTLTVNYKQDPFYYDKFYNGFPTFTYMCDRANPMIAGSKNLLLDGAFHNAFETAEGRAAVVDFAKWHLRQ